MGNCSCFYAEKLQKYKDIYPVSTKLTSDDPRLNDPQFLKQQIKKLDYIIKHQNLDLSKLQHQNQKLQQHPRNRKKVLNNSKKLFLLAKNGLICKFCLQQNDIDKISVDQLVKIEGLCGTCKGQGLKKDYLYTKDQRCGCCNKAFQYLWKIQLCTLCNGVGMFNTYEKSPYAMENDHKNHPSDRQLAKY